MITMFATSFCQLSISLKKGHGSRLPLLLPRPLLDHCSLVVYDLPLILLLTKDRLIFLLILHWQLMISLGHVVLLSINARVSCSFCSPSLYALDQLRHFPHCCPLCVFSENSSDKVEHSKFRSVSSKQLCTGRGTIMPLVRDLLCFGNIV